MCQLHLDEVNACDEDKEGVSTNQMDWPLVARVQEGQSIAVSKRSAPVFILLY
jgi:hypothetical protein